MEPDTNNDLLVTNKLLNIQLETIAKRLEARDVVQYSLNGKTINS